MSMSPVTSSDGNGGSLDQAFTINVASVNEAVTADDSAETTSENVALNGQVTATDLDGDTITYSLDGQPSEGTVNMAGDGSYAFNPGTDFDDLAVGESREVTFDFTADDGNGMSDTGTVTIAVTGTNDAPSAVDLSASDLDENDAGAVVGTLSTTDVDGSDSHAYAVSDDRFEVVDDGAGNMQLKLKDGVELDAEEADSVNVTVTSSDGNGGSLDQAFTVNVNNVNEGPSLSAEGSYNFLYNGSFEDFSNGTHGGTAGEGWFEGATIDGWSQSDIDVHEGGHMGLGATDGDYHVDLAGTTNGSLSREMEGLQDGQEYTLTMDLKSRGGTGDGSGTAEDAAGQSVAEIVWNGEVIATVDPSDDGMGWNSYSFNITAGSGNGSDTITFNEVGSDNNFGTILDNFQITDTDGFGVLENESGAEIATLAVDDPDAGDTHSYAVSDNRFEVVEQDGQMVLKLKDGESLDHETEDDLDVTVTVTDAGGLSDSQTMSISVGDTNEATVAEDSSETTGENAVLNGQVSATDGDGDSITYSVSSQPAEGSVNMSGDGAYSFDPGSDFDDLATGESREVSFDYTADDGNGSTDTGTVTIEVTGTNDAPSSVALSGDSTITEDATGSVVGTLSTTDVDASDTHAYAVSDNRFEVVDDGAGNMQLKLKDGQSIDADSEASVDVTVTSSDGNGGSLDETFSLTIDPNADAPTISVGSTTNTLISTDFEAYSTVTGFLPV